MYIPAQKVSPLTQHWKPRSTALTTRHEVPRRTWNETVPNSSRAKNSAESRATCHIPYMLIHGQWTIDRGLRRHEKQAAVKRRTGNRWLYSPVDTQIRRGRDEPELKMEVTWTSQTELVTPINTTSMGRPTA